MGWMRHSQDELLLAGAALLASMRVQGELEKPRGGEQRSL